MLKSATQVWGVQSSDIAAFDPIVNILLGACAVELEKVYNEINSSNARVLERLSKLLLPDVNKNTRPAHGILYAAPYATNVTINKYAQFVFSKRVPAKDSAVRDISKDVFFSPVTNFPLTYGSMKYIGTNNGLSVIDNMLYKEREVRQKGNKVVTKFVWLGLKMEAPLDESESLVFYFDWINNPLREKYLDFLPFTKWYCNGAELKYEKGISKSVIEEKAENNFNYDNEFVVCQNIMAHYSKRYITVDTAQISSRNNGGYEKYPDEFLNLYDRDELQQITDDHLWIKIVFPPFVTDDIVESMICQINCFPVVNRKLNEFTFRLHDADTFNIIPLKDKQDEASFFSMESVKSSDGLSYTSSKITDLNELNSGSYVIRKGGVQRFDSRNAKEYLSYMVDLLRDESAAFTVYGQEMLNTNLKKLSQQLSLIEQKIQRSDGDDGHSPDYLILRSIKEEDNVHVEYWSTAGSFANHIRIGSELTLYGGGDVDSSTIVMVSDTLEGRDELTASEMLAAFKQSLSSRERIVTIADIRNLCFSELGALVKDVKVSKDFVIESSSKTGFIRVIKVDLTPTNNNSIDDDWTMHKKRLEAIIENSSFSSTPVRINIQR